MREFAKVYRALIKANWALVLEYRAQVVLWILSSLFPLIMMVVWLAVVDEAGPITGWGRDDFISYYLAAAVVNQFIFVWTIWEWDEDIRTGSLSIKLLKPLDPLHHLVSEQVGWKLFILVFIVPLLAPLTLVFPAIHYPVSAAQLTLSFLAIFAGFTLSIFMSSAFGMIAFWSTQSANLYSLWIGVGHFLSGWVAPLALFPANFRQVAYWLPFRSMLGFPVEILTGKLTLREIGFGFTVTGLWLLFFLIVYRVLWRFGLRRYEAVGA